VLTRDIRPEGVAHEQAWLHTATQRGSGVKAFQQPAYRSWWLAARVAVWGRMASGCPHQAQQHHILSADTAWPLWTVFASGSQFDGYWRCCQTRVPGAGAGPGGQIWV
jgi:hypothetical protein